MLKQQTFQHHYLIYFISRLGVSCPYHKQFISSLSRLHRLDEGLHVILLRVVWFCPKFWKIVQHGFDSSVASCVCWRSWRRRVKREQVQHTFSLGKKVEREFKRSLLSNVPAYSLCQSCQTIWLFLLCATWTFADSWSFLLWWPLWSSGKHSQPSSVQFYELYPSPGSYLVTIWQGLKTTTMALHVPRWGTLIKGGEYDGPASLSLDSSRAQQRSPMVLKLLPKKKLRDKRRET